MSELFLVSEVARRLGVAATTVRRLEKSGALKAFKTPTGTRIFSRDESTNWRLNARRPNRNENVERVERLP